MANAVLLGVGPFMVPVPALLWRRAIAGAAREAAAGLGFMTDEHHRVRDFAVTELVRTGKPLTCEAIATELGLPASRVEEVLAELAEQLTFIARGGEGEVTWAYPVTVEATPHRARFSGGEEAYSP